MKKNLSTRALILINFLEGRFHRIGSIEEHSNGDLHAKCQLCSATITLLGSDEEADIAIHNVSFQIFDLCGIQTKEGN